ncbi:hypothetical protein [Lysobacter sp. CA199]|uniref:hypothetical protein n=1 Tax=Lysobacter sp. CA199 TaxID=3455608 RepID=UPI003F8D5412
MGPSRAAHEGKPAASLGFLVAAVLMSMTTAAHAVSPDLPMRRSAWLDAAMDSKTCPIVRMRPAAPTPAEGDAVIATVWRENDGDDADPATWPALFLSLDGQPVALRRSDGRFDVESTTLRRQRGADLVWSVPAERVSAYLRLRPPRLQVEDEQGGWTAVPASRALHAREHADASTRVLWNARLTVRAGGQQWQREVLVESLCGP